MTPSPASRRPPRAQPGLQAAALALPTLLGLGFSLWAPGFRGVARSPGEPGPGPGPLPALCGAWHPGAGQTCAVDLHAVRGAYARLAARLARSAPPEGTWAAEFLRTPRSEGLRACRASQDRFIPTSRARGRALRGRTLLFVGGAEGETGGVPAALEAERSLEIVVPEDWSEERLGALARTTGRPVSRGTPAFAEALGIRCLCTWVRATEDGRGLELHEAP